MDKAALRAKRFSQNFLIAPEFLEEIAEALGPLKEKTVLEIGAGTGLLTAELAGRAKKVVAIEIDGELIPALEARVGALGNVEIVHADAMEVSFSPFKTIFGAIPYRISSPLLFKIIESGFSRAVLVVQAEFGTRLAAQAGGKDWSRLSVMTQASCNAEIIDYIPAICFSPPPKVDSVIVKLSAKPASKRAKLNAPLVSALFQHKNQNVKKALEHSGATLLKNKEELGKLVGNLSPELAKRRVRTLTLEELEKLSKELP